MIKVLVGLLAGAILLGASAAPSYAWRHGGWGHPVFGGPRVVVGVAPPVFYTRSYVYPAPVVITQPPLVYTQSQQYWYYCENPAGLLPLRPAMSWRVDAGRPAAIGENASVQPIRRTPAGDASLPRRVRNGAHRAECHGAPRFG